jgi:hypothetical protein
MGTEFDKLKTLADWRGKLDELLRAARDVSQSEIVDVRMNVAERLTHFIIENPPTLDSDPATEEYEELDRVAKAAHDSLLLGTIQQRVAAIMGHIAEVAILRKKMENRVAANLEAAAALRLEKAKRVVDSATQCVAVMLDLKKEIANASTNGASSAELAALEKQLETVIDGIQALRNDVEKIV